MAIVCGVDFSETSERASRAAAALASRLQQPLHLVHSLELGSERVFDEPLPALREWAERQLWRTAEPLRASGAAVELHVEKGPPDQTLRNVAERLSATLIVVGAVGRRPTDQFRLGSHADRLAARVRVPVLVVRDPAPFESWSSARPLKVAIGVDSSAGTDAALSWLERLRRVAPCDVLAVHLYWPPPEYRRLGLEGVRSFVDPDPTVVRSLERDIWARFPATGRGNTEVLVEPHLGRVADRLAEIAEDHAVDLLLVGTHGGGPLARVWEGSVSRGVLQCARSSVVCVPASESERARSAPRLRRVMVATDLSDIGNAAVALAYSIVERGGTVDLVHVVKRPTSNPLAPHDIFGEVGSVSELQQRVRDALLAAIPVDASGRAETNVHLLESNRTAEAIYQAAERLGADVICLGTHGRSGLSKMLLGSVAQSVLERTGRPVLFTRGRRRE